MIRIENRLCYRRMNVRIRTYEMYQYTKTKETVKLTHSHWRSIRIIQTLLTQQSDQEQF